MRPSVAQPCLALTLLAALAFGAGSAARAARPEIPFDIRADQISYEQDRDLYEATGHVIVEQEGGGRLEADWVSFSAETQLGIATGHVRITEDGDTIEADFAAVDFSKLTALATMAALDTPAPGFRVSGEVLQKTGPQTYQVERASFTTCRCQDPDERAPWSIEAERADIEVEGYALAKNVQLRALEVPFLYLPYMLFPVKTKRQSGFLMPTYASDSLNGYEIGLPFFWALRPDLNLILHPSYMTKRGPKFGTQVEYLFGERSWAEADFGLLLGDRAVDETDPETPYSDDRWGGWLRLQHPLGPGAQLNFDVEQASDNDYVLDFRELAAWRNDRFLRSSIWASVAKHGFAAHAELAWVDDLQSPDNLDRDDFLLQRLPDLGLLGVPRTFGLPALRFGFDSRYTYFYQEHSGDTHNGLSAVGKQFFDTGADGVFDAREPNPQTGIFDGADNHRDDFGSFGGFEGDDIFQEGELLADSGYRIDLYPRLSLPLRAGPIETLSEIGLRETLYFSNEASSARRTLYTGRFDARIRLAREFQRGEGVVRHLLEPHASFNWISHDSQASNPLFIPEGSVTPERLITFDPRVLLRSQSDRIDAARLLILGVGNRFFRFRGDGSGTAQFVGELEIGSGYDFERSRIAAAFVEASFYPSDNLEFEFELGYDLKDRELDELLGGFRWSGASGHSLGLDYRYLKKLPIVFEDFPLDPAFEDFDAGFKHVNQLRLSGNFAALRRLDLFGGLSFDFENDNALRGRLGFALHSSCDCWDLIVQAIETTRPPTTQVTVELRLAGLGLGSEDVRGSQARH
ncbi:MAG: LPS-assembly protein LptD [Myxococcales bacterium]|nr:LPS-assembly protein LptD [Myxococcales bacterium]